MLTSCCVAVRLYLIYPRELFTQNVKGVIRDGQGEIISISSELSRPEVMPYTAFRQRRFVIFNLFALNTFSQVKEKPLPELQFIGI